MKKYRLTPEEQTQAIIGIPDQVGVCITSSDEEDALCDAQVSKVFRLLAGKDCLLSDEAIEAVWDKVEADGGGDDDLLNARAVANAAAEVAKQKERVEVKEDWLLDDAREIIRDFIDQFNDDIEKGCDYGRGSDYVLELVSEISSTLVASFEKWQSLRSE